jgi:hypothetical protein
MDTSSWQGPYSWAFHLLARPADLSKGGSSGDLKAKVISSSSTATDRLAEEGPELASWLLRDDLVSDYS